MSDVENTAQTGAQVAPVENTATPQEQTQEQVQESTTEQVETQEQQDRVRDEKGRYVPQERVNEITKARRTAERNWEAAERRAQELEQRLAQVQGQRPQTQGDGFPTLSEYEYDEAKWGRAVMEFAEKRAQERISGQQAQRSQQEMSEKFEERARTYAAANPDYDQAISELGATVRFPPEIIEAVGLSEHGPAIVHYLAKHLDEADRIARLPAHLAAVHLGRIEAQVSTPKAKPVTQAPSPAPTVSGSSTVSKGIRPGMSYAEYKAARGG